MLVKDRNYYLKLTVAIAHELRDYRAKKINVEKDFLTQYF
jgi:hypothetical protein